MQQKWEYCVITGIDVSSVGFKPHFPKLTYFSLNGIETQIDLGNSAASKRSENWKDVSEAGYVAHIIAKLGMEGWEMVGTGSGSSNQGTGIHCNYFRRPINDVN